MSSGPLADPHDDYTRLTTRIMAADGDPIGRLVWRLAQGAKAPETHTYDAMGNDTARTAARGHIIRQTFDALKSR